MSSILIRRANMVSGSPPQPSGVDLTSLFTWTDGAFNSSGGTASNSFMRRSNSIDISPYAGWTMKVTWMDYKTTTGGRSTGYGLFFYDADNNILYNERVPLATTGENGTGHSIDNYEITIPSNAVGFKTLDFRTSVTFPHSTFSCKVYGTL